MEVVMSNFAPPASERSELLAKPLDSFRGYRELPKILREGLTKKSVYTVGDLAYATPSEILRIDKVGMKKLGQVEEFLTTLGFDGWLNFECLSEAEEAEIGNRRKFLEFSKHPLKLGVVDYYLAEKLESAGIQMVTELVSAPALVLDEVTEGNECYRRQIDELLRRSISEGFRQRMWLRMSIPAFLPDCVPVYRTP